MKIQFYAVLCRKLIDVFSTVPGLMEHEAIPNISSSRRIGGKSGGGAKPGSSQKTKAITVSTIIKEVSDLYQCTNMIITPY